MLPAWRPLPLLRLSAAFDHPDWLFELKHDGFRAFAVIERFRTRFISRQGNEFKQWPQLSEEVAHAIRARHAVLDGEVVCLRPDGLSDFYSLMFRRELPYFYAFDLLELDGEDLRARPMLERKRRLAKIIPFDIETRLRLLGHVPGLPVGHLRSDSGGAPGVHRAETSWSSREHTETNQMTARPLEAEHFSLHPRFRGLQKWCAPGDSNARPTDS